MNLQIWKSIVKQRTIRNLKSKEKRHRLKGGKPKYKIMRNKCFNLFEVIAPSKILLTREIGYSFVHFKEELETKAKLATQSKSQLKLSFRDTFIIDAPACSVLIAVLDTIKCQYPTLKFQVVRPKSKPADHRKHLPYDVDAVFCHIGLYKLLGFNYTSSSSQENVKCWHFIQSDIASGKITEPLFKELKEMGITDIYSSYFEAIANAVEHAYDSNIPTKRHFPIKRWWMLMAVLEGKLSLFICDLGHGIPNTLEKTQKESLLKRIWQRLQLSGKPTQDSMCIKASTLIKETRTELEYRGKGGGDIRAFIDKTPNSQLIIRSNRGMYVYNGKHKPDLVKESLYSLNGTVVQWAIQYPVK
ncbi:hypothetical protein Q7511_09860 [Glaesserella parasuis]|nr:hypothetical protein [Glaesserella parasuis]MCT8655742.1 hypothetical protein [Glaesserella parasuis]MCT8740963.1 hypothetical protein [Glaesserella parasuis]MCT8836672.1 hypothetical protein [Glaesserella parasuis]MDO9783724.1 hypothetical protein [Glaesserella parasuis]